MNQGVTLWAAYLCLLLVVAGWVIIFGKPTASGLGRYRYHGRHWANVHNGIPNLWINLWMWLGRRPDGRDQSGSAESSLTSTPPSSG